MYHHLDIRRRNEILLRGPNLEHFAWYVAQLRCLTYSSQEECTFSSKQTMSNFGLYGKINKNDLIVV